ncbi:MBL fold metallo-hydrolase [Ottowia thiooxydans]|uniref:Glyoxylase-like metal-dependent hydrolase (Beta-lactamase superfamily II) n=1 Tax=Ottowia thiooxydans TaxID=219182 RepID=A0ABV2Q4N6_9BURK
MDHCVIDLGGVRITRLVESEGPLLLPAEIFPDSTPEIIKANLDWLVPRFYDAQTDRLIISIQSFLLEAEGRRILVDTCVGDCKDRARPDFHQQRWNWLDGLRNAGISPEQIDIAVSTHLHVDHVGWHTRLEGDRWVPTFPNARYLFTYPEWEYWKNNEGHPALVRSGDYIGDSVWPLFHAGVADLVPMDHEIAPGVRLVPLPGHTPGHVGIAVEGKLKDVFLTGDLFHHPLQCCYPHWNTRFCLAPEQSRSTREAIMERCANEGTLLMPAHFPAPNVGRLERVTAGDTKDHPDHVYRYTFAERG